MTALGIAKTSPWLGPVGRLAPFHGWLRERSDVEVKLWPMLVEVEL